MSLSNDKTRESYPPHQHNRENTTDKYYTLFNSIEEGFCIIELIVDKHAINDFIIRELNDSFARQSGIKQPITGKRAREVFPDLPGEWFDVLRKVYENGERILVENYLAANGRWYSLHHSRVGGDGSLFLAIVFQDITKRKKAELALRESEERKNFLLQFSDALRPLADPVEIQKAATKQLALYLGVIRVSYFEIDQDQNGFVQAAGYETNTGRLPAHMQLSDFGEDISADYLAGRTVIFSNTDTDPRVEAQRSAYRQIGVRAWVGVPLVKNGSLLVVLGIHSEQPREWTSAEVALLEEVAERTWAAVERARIENHLRENELKYRGLFDSIDEGFCVIELLYDDNGNAVDYRFIEVNKAYGRHTGQEDPTGKLGSEISGNTEPFWLNTYAAVARTGKPIRFEQYHEGSKRWYESYASLVEGSANRQVAIVFNDVTRRKEEEDKQSYLIKLNDSLRGIAEPEEIQSLAANLLGQHLKVNQSHYGDVIGDHVHIHYSYSNGLPPMTGIFRHEDFGLRLVEGYRSGHIQVCRNTLTDPAISEAEKTVLASSHIGAYISAPLIKDNEWVATLAVHSIEPREWKQNEINLVEETAERTWAAVERARVEFALRESEEHNRAIVSQTSVGIFRTDLAGNITFLNEKACQLFGFEGDEGIGVNVLELTVAEFRETTIKKFGRLINEGQAFESEKKMTRKDGAEFWANVSVSGIRNGDNKTKMIIAVIVDITHRKEAEEALKKSESLLKSVFNVSPIGIGLADTNGSFVLLNDEMRRFLPLGVLPAKDKEQSVRWIAYNEDGTRVTADNFPGMRALRNDPLDSFLDMQYINDDGNKTWTRVAAMPLKDDKGEIMGAVVVVTDIDKLKRITEALRESEQKLMQSLRQRDEFIGIASHELKTPVTSMKTYGEIVQEHLRESGDLENSELLLRLNTQIDRLTSLINHLLDTTKISEGQLHLQVEQLKLNDLLVERMEEIKRTSNHHFELQMEALPVIPADRERIGQVITNLLTNAIKYSPKGTTITIVSKIEDNHIRISVVDEGYGIPESDLEKIFERFFRVTANKMDTFPGMGLGLYITSQIIHKHGGTISVQSKEGKGSTFSFTLPYSNS